ncbi:hypothetical protein [Fodinicola acaciae]|uniref:hypothetical protein n=1 Tax=Fodinicola acaciae TaxID=2681555 RepID=UPI0013D4C2F4|nr:hypothetical protein [Fodinicola acaciae]
MRPRQTPAEPHRQPGPASRPADAEKAETRAGMLTSLQRTAGNRAVGGMLAANARPTGQPSVQRDGVKNKEGILDGQFIGTYADAEKFLTTRATEVEKERAAILGDGAPAPPQLFTAIAEGQQLAATVRAGGAKEIDEVTYDQVDAWYGKAASAMDAGENVRIELAAQKMLEIKQKAEKEKADIAAAQDRIADAKANAFRADDDSLLAALWSWSTALLDSGLAIEPVIAEATEMHQMLVTSARAAAAQAGPNVGRIEASFKIPEGGKVLPLLNNVNKLIAVYTTVTAAADLVSSKGSVSDKAKSDIKASVSLVSAVGTLIGASASISIALNLHIGPMTDACLNALGKLEDVARKVNRDLINRGEYDKVNWDLEQGGRPLFTFMLAVRNASGPDGVPQSVPSQVSSFFLTKRSEIEAGAAGGKAGDELPTTGRWFWKKVDQSRIRAWVFAHRDNLWASFYGSAAPGAST